MPSILNAPQYLTACHVQHAIAALVPPGTGIIFALLVSTFARLFPRVSPWARPMVTPPTPLHAAPVAGTTVKQVF